MRDVDSNVKVAGIVLVVLCGLFLYRASHPSTTFAADGMDRGWDAAAERAHSAGQPSVVLFTARWCGSCRWLHDNVLSRSDVQDELARHYTFYTVDLTDPSDQVQAHASKLGVSGIPCLIRYNADGKETDRSHAMSPEDMMAWLKAGE